VVIEYEIHGVLIGADLDGLQLQVEDGKVVLPWGEKHTPEQFLLISRLLCE